MNIIETIRAEIERQAKSIDTATGDFAEGRRMEQRIILSVLSDLEKECQWSAEDETKIAYICDVMSGKELVSDISPSYRSEIIEFAKSLRPAKVKSEKPTNPTLQEQPVCEELEGEADKLSDALFCEFFPQDGDMITPNDFRVGLRKFARHFYELGCRCTAEKYDEIEYKRQRADVCEGLEEEIDRFENWMETYNQVDYPTSFTTRDIARHFAQWQKEQMMNEGLVILAEEDFDAEKEKSVEWGYNLCKEQMMKGAVEADVNIYRDLAGGESWGEFVVPKPPKNLGDKVRIIIVKEEKDGTGRA